MIINMLNKGSKIFIAGLVIFILLIALVYIILTNLTKNISNNSDKNSYNTDFTGNRILSKDIFNFENISSLNLIYNSDLYSNDNTKFELQVKDNKLNEILDELKIHNFIDKSTTSIKVHGQYEIKLSNNTSFIFDNYNSNDFTAKYINNNQTLITEIPKDFKDKIVSIVSSYIESNTQIYYTTSLTAKNLNKTLDIDDNIGIAYVLEKCQYIYETNAEKDIQNNLTLIFNANTELKIDRNLLIGKLISDEKEKIVKIPQGLIDFIDIVFENNNHNLKVLLGTDTISLKSSKGTLNILNSTIIDDIVLYLYYSKIDYNNTLNYSEIIGKTTSDDFIITINDIEIIIPSTENTILEKDYISLPNGSTHIINIKEDFQTMFGESHYIDCLMTMREVEITN